MKLHDMWADYMEEVLKYRKEKNLSFNKKWAKPSLAGIKTAVRILSMHNKKDFINSTYTVLWDNGYLMECMTYIELVTDAKELFSTFLREKGIVAEL